MVSGWPSEEAKRLAMEAYIAGLLDEEGKTIKANSGTDLAISKSPIDVSSQRWRDRVIARTFRVVTVLIRVQ